MCSGKSDDIVSTRPNAAAAVVISAYASKVERFELPKSWTLLTYPYGHNIIIGSLMLGEIKVQPLAIN